ncbi:MAG: PEP-CTERM sorting domain-containing protein [Acidobacteriaceae bacterium]|nr:PEP-CTERM sorting domain-containing protein [Acidobacteriaceae bacterium]
MNIFRSSIISAIGAALALVAPVSATAADYTFQTLNNGTDPTFNQLLGINNAGTIAGYFGSGSAAHPNKGYTLAPPYTQTSYTDENFPNSVQTQVVGINSNSSPTTVGFWVDANANNFGFVKQGNTFTSVSNPNTQTGTMFTQLLGVNNNNIAVGFYADANGNFQGYSYNIATAQFTAINLPASFNAGMTTATGINNSGTISGFYVDAAGNTHGFLDSAGNFVSLDDPNGTNTMLLGLNNNGQVVGSFTNANGVTNGLVYDLGTKSWLTVNDPNASATPAFDVTGTTINGINDRGQLVGFYSDGANVNGFLATPVPEPASMGFMFLGTLVCGLAWRTKLLRKA